MQPPIMKHLIQLQDDLNVLTISCVEVNSCITDILSLYNGQQHRRIHISQKVATWTAAISVMSDALDKFQEDADKLGDYLDAQR